MTDYIILHDDPFSGSDFSSIENERRNNVTIEKQKSLYNRERKKRSDALIEKDELFSIGCHDI